MREIVFMAFLLISIQAISQTTLKGWVKDPKNEPVSGASVAIKETYDGATTDSTGFFSFSTSEKGSQVVQVTAIGYRTLELPVQVEKGSSLQLVLKEEIT